MNIQDLQASINAAADKKFILQLKGLIANFETGLEGLVGFKKGRLHGGLASQDVHAFAESLYNLREGDGSMSSVFNEMKHAHRTKFTEDFLAEFEGFTKTPELRWPAPTSLAVLRETRDKVNPAA